MSPRELARILRGGFRHHPYLIAFAVALGGLAVWALAPLPRRAIKHVILRCERIIEARDAESLRSILAADFHCPHTGDRDATLAKISDAFDYVLSLQLHIKHIKTRVHGDRATSEVDFTISGTLRGGEVYSQIPFYGLRGNKEIGREVDRCRLAFTKEPDGQWRISGAELLEPTAEKK